MAFISKDKVQAKRAAIQSCLKRYGLNGTLSGSNSSTLTLFIKSGKIDFDKLYEGKSESASTECIMTVSQYWLTTYWSDEALQFFKEAFMIMNEGNHDNSDLQTDYFDVGWYSYINIGKWNQAYVHKN